MTTTELDRIEPRRVIESTAHRPFISIIVPVRNEARCIAGTLAELLNQHYPVDRFEILVIDGASTDDTSSIVRSIMDSHRNVSLLENPKRWSSAGRNLGIGAAKGGLIVIVDGHCEIENEYYLEELAAAFERTGVECLGRPQPLEITSPSPLQSAIGLARSSRLGHHPGSHVFTLTEREVPAHSVAVAYQRSVFERVGCFDESFDACEDVELNHRVDLAGMRCVLVPSLRVAYHPRATLRGLFKQMLRYGRGRMRLLRKHPETFSVLGFGPALFVLAVLLGPFGFFVSGWIGLLYCAMLLIYASILLLASTMISIRNGRLSILALLPAVYGTLHFGAGMGILFEAISPGRHHHNKA